MSALELERPVEPEAERALVERARAGDRGAAAELLAAHELAVFRTCRHLLPGGEDLEAAVQETFVRALRSLHRYEGTGAFGSWLLAIAVNLCRDRLRRRRRIPFLPLDADEGDDTGPIGTVPADGPDPERAAMARQAVDLLRRELRRLSPRQREVFALRFFAGLELEGIARALAVDVGSVKTHLHRALRRVRARLLEARP